MWRVVPEGLQSLGQAIQGQITVSIFHTFHCTNRNPPTHTSNSVLVCFATAETKIESSRQVLLNVVKYG